MKREQYLLYIVPEDRPGNRPAWRLGREGVTTDKAKATRFPTPEAALATRVLGRNGFTGTYYVEAEPVPSVFLVRRRAGGYLTLTGHFTRNAENADQFTTRKAAEARRDYLFVIEEVTP